MAFNMLDVCVFDIYYSYITNVSINFFMILTKDTSRYLKIHYHGNVKEAKCVLGESLVLIVLVFF